MNLEATENNLIGRWQFVDGKMLKDAVCERIEWLTNHHLEKVAFTNDGWSILYRDPNDGRYWELSYPKSELFGGGPPCLTSIAGEGAVLKYKEIGKIADLEGNDC